MISKFINWNFLKEDYLNGIPDENLNLIEDLGNIFVETGTENVNYPKTNLHDSSIYKEFRITPDTNVAKISCVPSNMASKYFNTIIIQFNKLNINTLETIKNSPIKVEWYALSDSSPVKTGELIFNLDPASAFSNISYKDGIIFIDEGVLKEAGIDLAVGTSWNDTTRIDISMYNMFTAEYFSISNLVFAKSLDIYLDDKIDFERSNLDLVTTNKRTGSTFIQQNSNIKKFKSAISLLNNEELIDFEKFVRYNKSYPFYMFPYGNIEDDEGILKLNLEIGGLYIWNKKWKLKNNTYNIFDIMIALEEYK